MITTLINKEFNTYFVSITKHYFQMSLYPFIWAYNDPCKVSLNKIYLDYRYNKITRKEYLDNCTKNTNMNIITYAPTIIE